MSVGFEEVRRAALALPLEKRAQVVRALLASLGDPADDPAEVRTAWTAELRARIDVAGSRRFRWGKLGPNWLSAGRPFKCDAGLLQQLGVAERAD